MPADQDVLPSLPAARRTCRAAAARLPAADAGPIAISHSPAWLLPLASLPGATVWPNCLLAVDGVTIAKVAGQAGLLLLLLAGIVKCLLMMRRTMTSAPCVASLALVLACWFVLAVGQVVDEYVIRSTYVAATVALVCMLLLASAILVGVVGLIEFASKGDRYRQGQRQAISAIGLSMLTVFLLITVGVVAAVNSQERPVARSRDRLEALRDAIGRQRLADERPANELDVSGARASEPTADTRVFDELNFEYQSPGTPWRDVSAKALSADACFTLVRGRPNIFFIIIAEATDARVATDASWLAEIAKVNLQTNSESHRFYADVPRRIGRLDGIQFATDARANGHDLHYVHWTAVSKGFLYQLVVFGDRDARREVDEAASTLFPRFKLIDPERFAGGTSGREFRDARFGLTVDLGNTDWRFDPTVTSETAGAVGGASNADNAGLLVVPIFLHGEALSVDAVAAAFLDRIGLTFPSSEITQLEPLEIDHGQGYGMAIAYQVNGRDMESHARVAITDGFAYFVMAWRDRSPTKLGPQPLHEALELVSFHGVMPQPGALSEDEKHSHALFFNAAGIYLYNARNYARAAELFHRAFEMDAADPVMLSNYVRALSELGCHDEALEYLNRHLSRFPQQRDLVVMRAFLEDAVGDHDVAMTTFAELFAGDYRNDEAMRSFVERLVEQGRMTAATALLADYTRRNASFDMQRLKAWLYRQAGDYDRAIETLAALQAKIPFQADLAFELADVYDEAERYQEELELTQQLIDNGHTTAHTHYLMARSQYGLSRFPQAKQSLELALKADPTDDGVRAFLDHVSAMLGQGENFSVKDPIDPVLLPEPLAARLKQNSAAPPGDADSRYCYLSRAVEFVPGERYRVTSDV